LFRISHHPPLANKYWGPNHQPGGADRLHVSRSAACTEVPPRRGSRQPHYAHTMEELSRSVPPSEADPTPAGNKGLPVVVFFRLLPPPPSPRGARGWSFQLHQSGRYIVDFSTSQFGYNKKGMYNQFLCFYLNLLVILNFVYSKYGYIYSPKPVYLNWKYWNYLEHMVA
jgi:hypothetical protein